MSNYGYTCTVCPSFCRFSTFPRASVPTPAVLGVVRLYVSLAIFFYIFEYLWLMSSMCVTIMLASMLSRIYLLTVRLSLLLLRLEVMELLPLTLVVGRIDLLVLMSSRMGFYLPVERNYLSVRSPV